ncbi:hypothetical protein [Bacillus alkalicellulosilyticus]|uniref:hypothetical protein n=1 Tax=Alkalihalobacterium alkalicellulosilyticum TaxID=1912214 RepID=UPI0009989AAC|nr:hypothetical protein [Bacillus alkalicellulosilyticus]
MVEVAAMIMVLGIVAISGLVAITLIKAWQTKMKASKDQSYQRLAEEMLAVNKQIIQEQQQLKLEMAELQKKIN